MQVLPFALAVLLLCCLALIQASSLNIALCGSECQYDYDCMTNPGNPCTFCDRGKCTPTCGLGCSKDADCQGGGNPCTVCSSRRVCINPVPECGSFCGGSDDACRFNGTDACAGMLGNCCTCHPDNFLLGCRSANSTVADHCGALCQDDGDCSQSAGECYHCTDGRCAASQSSLCGTVCSGSGQCQSDDKCSQCVGYFCSEPASCGQVCLSSGQCAGNPGDCKSCVGTICSESKPCGGSCGGDDWCAGSCPVCWPATCTSSSLAEELMAAASEADFAEAEKLREAVRQAATEENRKRFGFEA